MYKQVIWSKKYGYPEHVLCNSENNTQDDLMKAGSEFKKKNPSYIVYLANCDKLEVIHEF